jgi:hypothetical protein
LEIKKHCVPHYENEEAEHPSGVEMVQSIDCEDVRTNGLQYQKPDISGLDMADLLSEQEVTVLWESLEEDNAAWLPVSTCL